MLEFIKESGPMIITVLAIAVLIATITILGPFVKDFFVELFNDFASNAGNSINLNPEETTTVSAIVTGFFHA